MPEHKFHDWVLTETTEVTRIFACRGCNEHYMQYVRVRRVPGKGDQLYFPPMPGDR